jgi:hypothetical protein
MSDPMPPEGLEELCDWLSALPPWIGPEDLGGGWILLDAEGFVDLFLRDLRLLQGQELHEACRVVRRVRAGLEGRTGWRARP